MKAWQFTAVHEPLVLNEVAEPVAVPGEVVIDVKAVGLCHSDVGMLEDENWPRHGSKNPITLGHEIAGVVGEVGEGVTEWKTGDRVSVFLTFASMPGHERDGGYAPRMLARAEDLIRIPEGVSWEHAAVGADAGACSYHALVGVGEARPGDKVGIIGFGGLGQIATRIAVLKGYEVYVATRNQSLWPLAMEMGARRIVGDIRELADEELAVIVDFAGAGTTTAAAVDAVRRGGRVVLPGMAALETTISTKSLIMKQVTLAGALGASKEAQRGVYDLMATGDLSPVTETIAFEEIAAGLARLSKGGLDARLVARFGD
ncbi:zinc-binding dehydrogenase [Streptomyces cylindrosporus]|uniref:2-deoxy-scyllo-inosamine dehydrogenase n=1 Tax=Streptomyces cylindrosporus TaxID=2927583 RepID=A0ABS9Y897_9ACTN|nr:zinc-binding dehydrogenase [Streptomyces cylindrosporus]MCI3273459.1 zinc-binding dehydrogenase [Streptomyces cylindrosporus]